MNDAIERLFLDKVLLITGGTGSFGNAVLRSLLKTGLREIRILSRDEKKQDDLRKEYSSPKLKCFIGDVREYSSVVNAMRGVDYVFHAAALKQVPSCEFFPMEAVKTNVIGTENVLEAAINCEVSRVVCLSTDKAVYPINAMGISKALMEKVIVAKSRNAPKEMVICATRYGNVMASRGSVIPLFVNQLKSGAPMTVTNPSMTRFMMSLEDAVDLVLFAFCNGNNGDIFVQKAPAASIQTLCDALSDMFSSPANPVEVIGTRHGEKLFEVLCSKEEMLVAEDLDNFFRIPPDRRDLNYSKYFEHGVKDLESVEDYNSHNTYQLNTSELKLLLSKLPYIRNLLLEERAL